ncbi:MAG: PIN domain-containing protein [Elusimicrobia bacterium]|nr:PIN domain-containing protein [Elusimicrobiota bacterium]
MTKILLDSDVIIAVLRRDQRVKDELRALEESGHQIYYTPIAKAEIYHGMREGEEELVKAFFSDCLSFDITDETGETAGRYLKQYQESHGTEIADALVAAAASLNNAELFTFNHKHYPMKDIKIYKI